MADKRKKRPLQSVAGARARALRQRAQISNSACRACPALCCQNLAISVLKPRTKAEIEEFRWQLYFDTVRVFITNLRWNLLVEGRCIYLDRNDLCKIYEDRPDKCRRHTAADCERFGPYYDVLISTPEELDAYFAKEKRRKARRSARKK